MRPPKGRSTDPASLLGVYKSLSDVPPKDRLAAFSAAYEDRDVWAEYVETLRVDDHSDRYWTDLARIGRRWKDHMADAGDDRHHALADPEHAESWAAALLDAYAPRTAHEHYQRLVECYGWLAHSTEHPHRYNPFLMAAAAEPAAARAWVGEHRDVSFALPDADPDAAEAGGVR